MVCTIKYQYRAKLYNSLFCNQLRVGRMLVMDAGCETAMNYCSDITRSVPVGGKFDARQKANDPL